MQFLYVFIASIGLELLSGVDLPVDSLLRAVVLSGDHGVYPALRCFYSFVLASQDVFVDFAKGEDKGLCKMHHCYLHKGNTRGTLGFGPLGA